MSNPLELAQACRQSLQRTAAALDRPEALPALATLLSAAGHLAELAHSSAAAPGACLAPLGPWCGHNPAHALQFLNTAPLLPAATGEAASAAAAPAAGPAGSGAGGSGSDGTPPPREHISPLEASRFDTALERSIHNFSASATVLMKR